MAAEPGLPSVSRRCITALRTWGRLESEMVPGLAGGGMVVMGERLVGGRPVHWVVLRNAFKRCLGMGSRTFHFACTASKSKVQEMRRDHDTGEHYKIDITELPTSRNRL